MMPTKNQCDELINNTFSEWITVNHKNGRKFYNRTYPIKCIFLPAAGQYSEKSQSLASSYGIYWTTKYYSSSSGYYFDFTSSNIVISYSGHSARMYGKSIRAIRTSPW